MFLSIRTSSDRCTSGSRFAARAFVVALFIAATSGAVIGMPVDVARADNELLIVNVKVFEHARADAVLVRGERIVAAGRRADLATQTGASAKVVDGDGGWLVPGFHDSHIHMLSGGLSLTKLDLTPYKTLDEVLKALADYAKAHPGGWIQGRGWQYGIVSKEGGRQFPTRQDLDRIVPDRPVYLTSYDGHSTWVNTRALELAEVTAETRAPAGGTIVREADGKTPQGVFLETADALISRVVPKPDRAARKEALRSALRHCSRLGLTSVDDLTWLLDSVEIYRELEAAGELPLRVHVSLPIDGDLARYAEVRESLGAKSSRLKIGFLKGFVDGVIESRTAYMLEPYANSTERGKPLLGFERMKELVDKAREKKFVVGVHAIGDGAVRLSLDAFGEANSQPASDAAPMLRGRIEHIEVMSPDDAKRFARSSVVASMMPFHGLPDEDPDAGVWSQQLDERRRRHSFPWRELLDAHATLAFGSDWPVVTADPLQGLAVAVTRRNGAGKPVDGWNAHQAITIDEAIRAYTHGSAIAAGRGEELGRIAPGYYADLVLLHPKVDLSRSQTLWAGERVRKVWVGGAETR